MLIEYPSGLIAEARKIKIRELDALAQAAEDEALDGGISAVLNGCHQLTHDPGVYRFLTASDAKPDWRRMLKGDLVYGLFKLRIATLGSLYEFETKCSHCGKQYEVEIDLSQMKPKFLPDSSKEVLRGNGTFEGTFLDGTRFKYRLGTTADEEPVVKLRRQQGRTKESIADGFTAQVFWLQALGDEGSKNIKKRWAFFDDLDADELFHVQDQLEAADCGIDVEVRSKCPKCNWRQKQNLPLGPGFFRPRTKKEEIEDETETETETETESKTETTDGEVDQASAS